MLIRSMMKHAKEISGYIRACLDKGYSFKKIEKNLIKNGYPEKVAEGMILDYRHKGKMFKWLTLSCLTLLFLSSVFLSGSGIIGMVTLDYSKNFMHSVNLSVNESSSYSWYIPNKGELSSIAITGNLIGKGDAKVYIENDDRKYLLFDSGKDDYRITDISSNYIGKAKHFEVVCEETCLLEDFNKSVYDLVFRIDNSLLEIDKIHYDVKQQKEVESVPYFITIPDQKSKIGSKLIIDLDTFFNSSYGEAAYRYIAENDSLGIMIDDSKAEIIPREKSTSYVYFIAEVNNVEFMSNLVKIEANDKNSGLQIIEGSIEKERDSIQKTAPKKNPFITLVLLAIILVVIISLAVIPSRYYDLKTLAGKVDSLKGSQKINSEIKNYDRLRSRLRNTISDKEKERILSSMEKKVKKISTGLPKSKKLREFEEKSKEFENLKRRSAKEKKYDELRSLYEKIIETNISKQQKSQIYKKMQKYYKKLKR